MKQITEYLSNKVKNQKALDYEFPSDPSFDDMVYFLKNNGFGNGFDYDKAESLEDADTSILKLSKKNNSNEYCYASVNNSKTIYWMRFCNHGKNTKDTPMLFCYVTTEKSYSQDLNKLYEELCKIIGADYIGYDLTNRITIYTWSDFKDKFFSTFNL